MFVVLESDRYTSFEMDTLWTQLQSATISEANLQLFTDIYIEAF